MNSLRLEFKYINRNTVKTEYIYPLFSFSDFTLTILGEYIKLIHDCRPAKYRDYHIGFSIIDSDLFEESPVFYLEFMVDIDEEDNIISTRSLSVKASEESLVWVYEILGNSKHKDKFLEQVGDELMRFFSDFDNLQIFGNNYEIDYIDLRTRFVLFKRVGLSHISNEEIRDNLRFQVDNKGHLNLTTNYDWRIACTLIYPGNVMKNWNLLRLSPSIKLEGVPIVVHPGSVNRGHDLMRCKKLLTKSLGRISWS